MRFGLIIRGQYPQGDDMRIRLKEDLDAAKRAWAHVLTGGEDLRSFDRPRLSQLPQADVHEVVASEDPRRRDA